MGWRDLIGCSENEPLRQKVQKVQKSPMGHPFAYIADIADKGLKSTSSNYSCISHNKHKRNSPPVEVQGDCNRRGCLGPEPCEWAWFEGGVYVCLRDGHRLWHPDDLPRISARDRREIERWERQRKEHGLDPELSWIYGGATHDR